MGIGVDGGSEWKLVGIIKWENRFVLLVILDWSWLRKKFMCLEY